MNRQAVVVGLSLIPFAASTTLALIAWESLEALETLWRMVVIVLVWIGVFAAGTQLFWKAVGLLATE